MWLMALVAVLIGGHWIPQSRWLLVHMVTLGVATTSILVWGQYFTESILHEKLGEPDRRRQVIRINGLNLGVLACCVGMVGGWPWVVVAGATVVGLAMCWYAVDLALQVRRALPGRFDATVRFYCAAACLLPVGAVFGAIMAFSPAEPWRTRLLLAHQGVNILGFVGMTAVGTLVTLWPTVLRTPMAPRQDRHGKVALVIMCFAVVVMTTGSLGGWWQLEAAGVLIELAGLVVIGTDLVRCAARKPPRDFPGYSMGAAICWFAIWLCWLAWTLVSRRDRLIQEDITALTVPIVMGFLLQLLLGAMSYLMPMVMGGGPSIVRATNAKMHTLGALRATATNAGLVIWALAEGTWTRRIGLGLAVVAMAGFLPAMVAMVKTGITMLRAKRAAAMGSAAPSASPSASAASSDAASPASASTFHSPKGGSPTPEPGKGPSASEMFTPPSRTPTQPGRPTARPRPDPAPTAPPGRRSFVEGVVGLGAALGAVAVGRRLDGTPALSGSISGSTTGGNSAAVAPSGRTTTVQVTMRDMHYHPSTIAVPPGDRLVVKLSNTDPDQVHDLYFANGAHSPRLSPGQRATVDAGVITGPTQGWCTIVGHRSMGMELEVTVDGAAPAQAAGSPAAGARRKVDLTQPPGRGFRTRDARLPALLPGRTHPMTLTVTESIQEVAPATTLRAMTYNGRVMGPVIHARIGDTMAVHLVNRGTMGHSIDFHAGTVSPTPNMRTIAPGKSLDYRFTLPRAGVWLYHCSTMPMSSHIASGMFGAVIVPPRDLPAADREYVLVQSETYLDAANGREVDAGKIAAETPDLTMFNGHANQYVFAPLTAKVGERVRIWVLAAGPSRGISFHVVGTQFDTVFKEGAYVLRRDNPEGGGAQALDLSSAQGGFVEMTFEAPGRYTFVNHSFVEMERGARGLIEVTS
ncbi:MAG: multicopper oxidase domain-containing protein [Acidipropionibacterium sp.]|jgi:nitrite reductase (NO-forming)|nr:multicopper oxidase domain-containing protein [Acidipropionibacterium sp.]